MDISDVLTKEGVSDILIALLDHPGISQKELEEISKVSTHKINQYLPQLALTGLITQVRRRKKEINLTELGKEKAQKFKDLLS